MMARVIALVALIGCGLVVVVLVSGSLGDGSDGDGAGSRGDRRGDGSAAQEGFRIVEPGDTLSGIADDTGVPVETLEQLNPDIDPQTLNSGQCVSLVERGCERREDGG
jgi:LysM domain